MGELEVRVDELKENITQLQLEKTELITKVTYIPTRKFIEVNNLIWGVHVHVQLLPSALAQGN